MSRTDSDFSLSSRRRAALRFDLEDRQTELIDELNTLADALFQPLRAAAAVPDAWQPLIAATQTSDAVAELRRLDQALRALYRVNRTLARIDGSGFGRCSECGNPIAFDLLAADPTVRRCRVCGAHSR